MEGLLGTDTPNMTWDATKVPTMLTDSCQRYHEALLLKKGGTRVGEAKEGNKYILYCGTCKGAGELSRAEMSPKPENRLPNRRSGVKRFSCGERKGNQKAS